MPSLIAPLSVRLSAAATWHSEQADKAKRERNTKAFDRHEELSDVLFIRAYHARQAGH